MLSNIQINFLSPTVVPLIEQEKKIIIENKPPKVEAVSPTDTNVGYNSNRQNNNFYYMEQLKVQSSENNNMEPDKGNHIDIRI